MVELKDVKTQEKKCIWAEVVLDNITVSWTLYATVESRIKWHLNPIQMAHGKRVCHDPEVLCEQHQLSSAVWWLSLRGSTLPGVMTGALVDSCLVKLFWLSDGASSCSHILLHIRFIFWLPMVLSQLPNTHTDTHTHVGILISICLVAESQL